MVSELVINNPAFVSALSDLLFDVYHIMRPRPADYEHRKCLYQMLSAVTSDTFGSRDGFPVLQALGSFTMDLFTTSSDLDLSVNFSHDDASMFDRDKKITVLRKFARALYAKQRIGCVSGVIPLVKARVPTLKLVDCESGVKCDITVGNTDGISRSLILKIVSSMDGRFRILCYLMKAWAKAQGINSSQHGTLTSLSVITLVVLHMQTRDPPILPPFSTLLRDGVDITNVRKAASEFKRNSSRVNEESVGQLFYTLLRKLALVQKSWEHGLCASVFEGSWICKTWEMGDACTNVEDFLDRSENCTRAVGKDGMENIYRCIWTSLYHLTRFEEDKINACELKNFLFGSYLLKQRMHNEGIDFKSFAAYFDKPIMLSRKRKRISEPSSSSCSG